MLLEARVLPLCYFMCSEIKKEKPDVLLNVLSKQNGDDIYLIKDQYKRMTAFAWGII